MPDKEPGYVYILTNPSFREDSKPTDVYQGIKCFAYNRKVTIKRELNLNMFGLCQVEAVCH